MVKALFLSAETVLPTCAPAKSSSTPEPDTALVAPLTGGKPWLCSSGSVARDDSNPQRRDGYLPKAHQHKSFISPFF